MSPTRREFLGTAVAAASVAVPASPEITQPPDAKLFRFRVWTGHTLAETDLMEKAKAYQFLKDTVRDMATVLGQGKVYPRRPEPEWLTKAVDNAVASARERVKAARVTQWQNLIEEERAR